MLSDTLAYHIAQIVPLLTTVRSHVEQLVLVYGGSWQDRSTVLQAISPDQGLTYIDIGLPFAKTLLGQSPRERTLSVMEMLDNLSPSGGSGIALDKIEILFDPELQIDPLRTIQRMAHRQLILLSWPGRFLDAKWVYAEVGHPEYRVYPASDIVAYSLENLT